MRCCAICRWPASVTTLHPGEIHGIGVRCDLAHKRLPHGTTQKRLNAAARLAASDISGRYWTARFPDQDAAALAARMLGNPTTGRDAARALGWIE